MCVCVCVIKKLKKLNRYFCFNNQHYDVSTTFSSYSHVNLPLYIAFPSPPHLWNNVCGVCLLIVSFFCRNYFGTPRMIAISFHTGTPRCICFCICRNRATCHNSCLRPRKPLPLFGRQLNTAFPRKTATRFVNTHFYLVCSNLPPQPILSFFPTHPSRPAEWKCRWR